MGAVKKNKESVLKFLKYLPSLSIVLFKGNNGLACLVSLPCGLFQASMGEIIEESRLYFQHVCHMGKIIHLCSSPTTCVDNGLDQVVILCPYTSRRQRTALILDAISLCLLRRADRTLKKTALKRHHTTIMSSYRGSRFFPHNNSQHFPYKNMWLETHCATHLRTLPVSQTVQCYNLPSPLRIKVMAFR